MAEKRKFAALAELHRQPVEAQAPDVFRRANLTP
jgi:hypothetical protein